MKYDDDKDGSGLEDTYWEEDPDFGDDFLKVIRVFYDSGIVAHERIGKSTMHTISKHGMVRTAW